MQVSGLQSSILSSLVTADKTNQHRFTSEKINSVKKLISVSEKIVITTHHRPDGDAMGSSLGLYNYLSAKGYNVTVVVPSDFPDFLRWLPGTEKVIDFGKLKSQSEDILKNADVIFCLDFNSLSRVEDMEQPLDKSKAKKILIDHHLDPENIFEIAFSDSDACSTCELVFDFIVAMNDKELINEKIAECLYCGIMTDTNSFRFSSMTARTHRIIADLMEAGARNNKIHELVYDNSSEAKMHLTGFALQEKLTVLKEFNTAYITLSEQELKKFDFKSGDTEGLVNYALGIKGIRLAAFFSEKDGSVKISFRSKNDFSVKELSAKYFGGGGHKNASGGYSSESLDKTVNKFLDILPEYKSQLTSAS